MYAYSSVLAALLERGRTGRGAHLDVSMLESTVEWMGFPLYDLQTARSPPPGGAPPPRAGRRTRRSTRRPTTAGTGSGLMRSDRPSAGLRARS
ncbi:CoA transferase [Streptomyces sp. DHE17-7]|uniref:CoA transferase n=1 Tax=Streptomyces sp. DHE17-7 TaxID=2759949 RepID=UPI003FA7989F